MHEIDTENTIVVVVTNFSNVSLKIPKNMVFL